MSKEYPLETVTLMCAEYHNLHTNESRMTPLRVVLDCSAKTLGDISLDNCLYEGPSLIEKLGKVVLKFRASKLAYMTGIQKPSYELSYLN